MKTIWKYKVRVDDCVCVGLPKGYKILKFGKQNGNYYIWALVDTMIDVGFYNFSVVGTGNNITDKFLKDHKYVDTWIENDGPFVWHLFKEI